MFKVGIAQCEGADTSYVIRNVVYNCLEQIRGFQPTAGILFAADVFDHQIMLDEVLHHFPEIALVGCCSAGELSSAAGFSDDSICLMVICTDTIEIGTGFGEHTSEDPEQAVASAVQMAKQSLSEKEKIAIVLVDGFVDKHLDIIECANRQVDDGCGIFGGFSSVQRINYGTIATTQFYRNRVLKDAVVVLLMAGPIEHTYCLCNSWHPVGKQAAISETDGAAITKIGDMSALGFYHYYLGSHTNPAIENPFAVYENDRHFYLRVPTDYDATAGSISFPVDMPTGAKIQITESSRARAVEDIRNSLQTTLQHKEGFHPNFAFVFSCDIRKNILGTQAEDEIKNIKNLLPPSIPIVGFYTRGEIAPIVDGKESIVHHCTLITLLIQVTDNDTNDVVSNSCLPKPLGDSSFANIKNEIIHHMNFLERKYNRENYYREMLELNKEINVNIFRRLNQELNDKNQELERLYKEIDKEKEKSEALLLNILPNDIAEQLKQKGEVTPEYHRSITVIFTDFVSFTTISDHFAPADLVEELNYFFTHFDRIADKWGLEKIRTIGDAYMAAGGLFDDRTPHAFNTIQAAIEMQDLMHSVNNERAVSGDIAWSLRIGINTGPLIAGVIGQRKFAYEIWGDTVNVASRLESTCVPGRINISRATYDIVKDCSEFIFESRGRIKAKNKGELDMYFVDKKPLERRLI